MSKTHLVISDQHASPDHGNDRADWLARLIIDVQPEVVVNIGDAADMASLASYDKGTRRFIGKSYSKDIESHLDFQERLWGPVKARKKRLPYRVFLEGNHEERIERAIDVSPELNGAIGFKDLKTEDYYDGIIRYEGRTPGIVEIDGVHYAHYFVSGIMGRPVAGEHPAYSLCTKEFQSCVAGHSHLFDYCIRTTASGQKLMGLVCGVYQDYDAEWAGTVNRLWHRGICILRNVDDGRYDLQFVSLESMRKEYGNE